MTERGVEYERFPNAPIVEALLVFRFPAPQDPIDPSFARFHDGIRDRFPRRTERAQASASAEFAPSGEATFRHSPPALAGYDFSSEDGLDVVRVDGDVLSIHRLKPYSDWSTFRNAALPVWQAYIATFAPQHLIHLGLRYINRIELPFLPLELREYLNTYPEVASPLDTGLSSYLLRLVIPDPPTGTTALLTQALEPEEVDTGVIPLIFDIEIARNGRFPVKEGFVRETFDAMREVKNRLFFESITEKTKEMFR